MSAHPPTSPSSQPLKKRSTDSSPFDDVAWLSESLIRSPKSFADHLANLALCAVHPQIMLELGYRAIFPTITHADLEQLINQPEFREKIDRHVGTRLILKWPAMVMQQAEKALRGDAIAFRNVAERLGYAQAQPAGTLSGEEIMSRLADNIQQAVEKTRQPEPIEVKAEVK